MLRRGLAPSRSRSCRCRARECERGDLGGVRCPGACVDAGRPGSRRRDNTTGDRPGERRSGDDRPLARPQVPQVPVPFLLRGSSLYHPYYVHHRVACARCRRAVTALHVPPYFLPSHFITPGFWISRSTQCMGPWERGSPTSSLDHGIPSAAQPREKPLVPYMCRTYCACVTSIGTPSHMRQSPKGYYRI